VRYVVWTLLLVSVALFVGACLQEGPQGPGGEPAAKGSAAHNTFCYVCHLNFKKEKLAVRHARAAVGCTECHGSSLDHSDDEDNITPPDIMYPKQKINPSCMKCHRRSKLEKVSEHRPVLAAVATGKKHCTDCHGDHRIAVRTRRWDKETGELIADDGVRMIATQPVERK
jgi:hypothetical protein